MDLTQDQIIERFRELLELPVEETAKEAKDLQAAFYTINHQLLETQKEEHREIGARMDDFVPVANPLEDTFKELLSRYKDLKAKFAHQKREAEKKCLAEKKQLVADLKNLIDNEENIGKSFDRFKDLQDKWRTIGPVPADDAADLVAAYRAEVDRFYYNITINKELKEYDLAKNLEIRDAIVKKLEELQAESKIKDIELILSAAKEEWDDAGPVKPEVFAGLRDRYYDALKVLHKKIQDFYSERKDEMQANLDRKREMVSQVLALAESDISSMTKWNKATEEIQRLRDEWKTVGPVEKKFHEQVWVDFKQAQDKFFAQKKEFLGEARETFKEHKAAKEKLIAEAEQLKTSTDWKETTDALIKLQNQWKKVGAAGPRDDNRLWAQFRAACDAFFTSKKEFYDTLDDRQTDNLKAKEAHLQRMAETTLAGSDDEKLATIKLLGDDWSKLGHVPKKDVKRISEAYEKAIGKLYAQMKMTKDDVERVRFKNKVARMSDQGGAEDALRKEESFLRKKLAEKKDELLKYENNMAFFAHAKPDNPLLVNALKNIEVMKKEVEDLTEKIKVLKVSARKLQE